MRDVRATVRRGTKSFRAARFTRRGEVDRGVGCTPQTVTLAGASRPACNARAESLPKHEREMSERRTKSNRQRRTVEGFARVGDATPDAPQPRLVESPEGEQHERVRRLPVPLSQPVPGFGAVDFPRAGAFVVAVGGYSFRSRHG